MSENPNIKSKAVFGDVTALTLIDLVSDNGKPTELLLGAIGSQIHVFSLPSCSHLTSSTVLPNAIRCHGIASCTVTPFHSPLPETWLAVHGDRYANICKLEAVNAGQTVRLTLIAQLPRLVAWTMAIHIQTLAENPSNALLTVGLSDNSVEFYRISAFDLEQVKLLGRNECSDQCLLYSQDLFYPQISQEEGSKMCLVAGGTIFLDVVVYAAGYNSSLTKDAGSDDATCTTVPVLYRLKGHDGSIHTVQWGPCGLTLASGSDDRTVRLWNIPPPSSLKIQNGVQKLSISGNGLESTSGSNEVLLAPRHVLYGHSARLWGFTFTLDEGIVVSASEDGTCKFWDAAADGRCIATLKAHRFRGVWHCRLRGSVLVTSGADSGIKMWSLWDFIESQIDVERIINSFKSIFSTENGLKHTPSSLELPCPWKRFSLQCLLPNPETTEVGAVQTLHTACNADDGVTRTKFDSTSEVVRCLALTRDHKTLFVATNRGLVHQVQLPQVDIGGNASAEKWVTIYKTNRKRPFVTLNVLESADDDAEHEIRLGACDIMGYAVVLTCSPQNNECGVWRSVGWRPYPDKAALAVHFFPTMPRDRIFTTGPGGQLTLWSLAAALNSSAEKEGTEPVVLADEAFAFKKATAIVSLAAMRVEERKNREESNKYTPWTAARNSDSNDESRLCWLLAAGTSCGGIELWRLDLAGGQNGGLDSAALTLLSSIPDAHFNAPVKGIALEPSPGLASAEEQQHSYHSHDTEIESYGSNGYIARFAVLNGGKLSILGEETHEAVLIVAGKAAINPENNSTAIAGSNLSSRFTSTTSDLVYGFHSKYFNVWNAASEARICTIECGSWRRPYAHKINTTDNLTFCWENRYNKIEIYTRRPLKTAQTMPPLPFALHPAGHGREVNDIKLLSFGNGGLVGVTAGEDSAVRQFVLQDGSSTLGLISDHVGGTTVKALAVEKLPEIWKAGISGGGGRKEETEGGGGDSDVRLIVSSGSKEVLMAWLMSTDPAARAEPRFELISCHASPALLSCKNLPEGQPNSAVENRYLAVSIIIPPGSTAAAVVPCIAFVLAGTSFGHVDLLALSLEPKSRTTTLAQSWHRVATLERGNSPVLALDSLVLQGSGSNAQGACIAFATGTDGSLAVWDIAFYINSYLDAAAASSAATGNGPAEMGTVRGNNSRKTLSYAAAKGVHAVEWKAQLLHPLEQFQGVHQSGINGMSAAEVTVERAVVIQEESGAHVIVVTVGDDQTLCASLLQFTGGYSRSQEEEESDNRGVRCTLRCAASELNAHSSATRDVWTDGTTAFSTGLDQRVRRWKIDLDGSSDDGSSEISLRITETGCKATQVIEPVSVDVMSSDRNEADEESREESFVVGVAGRGLQVLEWK